VDRPRGAVGYTPPGPILVAPPPAGPRANDGLRRSGSGKTCGDERSGHCDRVAVYCRRRSGEPATRRPAAQVPAALARRAAGRSSAEASWRRLQRDAAAVENRVRRGYSSIARMTRQGFPAANTPSGTSRVTTLPAPITAREPIRTPARIAGARPRRDQLGIGRVVHLPCQHLLPLGGHVLRQYHRSPTRHGRGGAKGVLP
jgi:hypothetical protein